MNTRRAFILGLFTVSLLGAQDGQPTVQITGAVKQAFTLTADDLGKMHRAPVRTTSNGMENVYEGVWLLASYLLAEAQEGYQVVFSLGEPDPAFSANENLLADTANGKPLFGAQGRLRLVVPKNKPGARSVRMLTKLKSFS